MKRETRKLNEELAGIRFGDDRLNQRLHKMMEGLATNPAAPIARSFVSGAEAKAAYRFFENDKVDAKLIRAEHRQKTLERMQEYDEVLVIQDTTFLDYSKHLHKEGLGSIGKRRKENSATQGLVAHHALAVTLDGVPLGLLDQAVWAREKEKSVGAKVESRKWVNSFTVSFDERIKTQIITVCDREADIDELLNKFQAEKKHFVLRAKKTRISVDQKGRKIIDVIRDEPVKTSYQLKITDRLGVTGRLEGRAKRLTTQHREATLEVRALKVKLKGVHEEVNAVLVTEKSPPPKGNEICWFLLTDLPIETAEECLKIVKIYTMRWLIEIFFKTLKTGCGIEECRFNDGKKVETYLALMSVIAWWLLYLQQLSRVPNLAVSLKEIFDDTELRILKAHGLKSESSLEEAVEVLCRLGGYKKFKKTDRPGIYSIWLGWLALQTAIRVLEPFGSLQYVGNR